MRLEVRTGGFVASGGVCGGIDSGDRPAGKAPQARRATTTEMNNDDKDDSPRLLLLQAPVEVGGANTTTYY